MYKIRSCLWFLVGAALCGTAARGVAETPQEEIARLKAEAVMLHAENRMLKDELAKLKDPTPDENKDNLRPQVLLYAPAPGTGPDAGKVIFSWRSTGATLADQPISLYYAEKPAGPWRLIADALAAEGSFAWSRPGSVPAAVFLSCRAREGDGNEVAAETKQPFHLDFPTPRRP
jgi:hypothetical protein